MYRRQRSASNRSYSYQSKQARIQNEIKQYAKKLQTHRRRIDLYKQQRKQIEQEMKKTKKGIFSFNKSLESTKSKQAYAQILNYKKKSDVFHKRNNQTIERINALKSLINKLRFEKRTTKQTVQRCEQQLLELNKQLDHWKGELNTKDLVMNNAKDEIIGLKTKIQEQQSSFVHRFKKLKRQFEQDRLRNTKNQGKLRQPQKYNTSDTSTLLRRKLQAIIVNNKQKIKMIDSYQRNMKILDDAFTTMKQASGLTDIKQIETVFIKSQDQNCELLTYLNTLNQQIETLQNQNAQLVQKCDNLEVENKERQQLLNRVPEDEIKRERLQVIQSQKLLEVKNTNKTLNDISPKIIECIFKLKGNSTNKQATMNILNYRKFIRELQDVFYKMIHAKSNLFGHNLLEDVTDFDEIQQKLKSKTSDNIIHFPNYEIPLQNQSSMMEYQSLRQIASQAIKKPIIQTKQKEKPRKLSK